MNRSVALASLYGGPGKLYHLEIQLHQAVVSELAESSGKVELLRTIPLPGCGLLQLQERLVEIIAAAFIRQTRFDPRRKADTEQLLYDALPTTLRDLQSASEANIEIGGYRARIVRSELVVAGNRLFDSAPDAMGVLAPTDRVILDPLANLLPGLRDSIPQTELLAGDALPQALNQHLDTLVQRNETLNFITALPSLSETISPSRGGGQSTAENQEPIAPAVEEKIEPVPTHLLRGAVATPLHAEGTVLESGLELFSKDGSWQLRGTISDGLQVNGGDYRDDTALKPGDSIISAAGATFVLIEVQV